MAGLTISQKILARNSSKSAVHPGEIVEARVDLAMSHDNALLVSKKFKEIGAPRIWDADKVVIPFDHRTPAPTIEVANGHAQVRQFIKAVGIKNFYDVGVGICHQVLPEKGHIKPGMLVVGTDSHTTTYGAFGAFATGIGATEMAGVWATGKLWFRVPETFRFEIQGPLPRHVYAKDLILHVIGEQTLDGCDYRAVEFYGSAIDRLTADSRMTIANLSMEMGAKVGLLPVDDHALEYLSQHAKGPFTPVAADPDASYERTFHLDARGLEPQVACPHSVDNVKPITEVEGVPIDQIFIGTCTNGRYEDFKAAADILRGETIHPRTRMLMIPASRDVFLECLQKGIVTDLTAAGVTVESPGCGPCLGAHQGVLGAGEKCFSTTNRNFRGRMGHIDSEVYLGSPAAAASTALYGEITDPRRV